MEWLNELTNEELIKLIGTIFGIFSVIIAGLFAIINGIISFWLKFQSDRDVANLNGQLQERIAEINNVSQREIANLNSELNRNNQYLSSLTSVSNIAQQRRVQAIEKFWNLVLEIKDLVPAYGTLIYSILSPQEIDSFFEKESNLRQQLLEEFYGIQPETNPRYKKLFDLSKECELLRPFLGEQLWASFFLLQGFIGRTIYILHRSVELRKLIYWKDDDYFQEVFLRFLSSEEKAIIDSDRYHGFNRSLEVLEQRFLNEFNNVLSGKRHTYDSVEVAKLLIDMKEKSSAYNI